MTGFGMWIVCQIRSEIDARITTTPATRIRDEMKAVLFTKVSVQAG
jgi:hypothetical protein